MRVWVHFSLRESAPTHILDCQREIYRKAFYIIEDFFFPSLLTYCWVRYFVSEQHLLCRGARCVFVCVHKRYFGVYFQEPVQMWHEFLCWHLYYVCQQIPSFKCRRLTVHGDDLPHHLQQYAYYITRRPFLHCKAWLEHTWASAQSSVTRSSHTSRTGLRAR